MSTWLIVLKAYCSIMFLFGIIFVVWISIDEKKWEWSFLLIPFLFPFLPFIVLYGFIPRIRIKTEKQRIMEWESAKRRGEEKNRKKNSFHLRGYERHRINTDGEGVCTLVVLDECPLDCKHCLNPKAKSRSYRLLSIEELYNKVRKDHIYFQETGGGITFGGGEPLLQSRKILKFKSLCPDSWKLNIETSLNVPWENIERLIDIVDWWCIDIKDMNDDIYFEYTGCHNQRVIDNLKQMVLLGLADKMHIRVPYIPNYNTAEDIEESIRQLKEIGLNDIEKFVYDIKQTPKTMSTALTGFVVSPRYETYNFELNRFNKPDENGKKKCEYLKKLRKRIAEKYNIDLEVYECNNTGGCVGTCIACDIELERLSLEIHMPPESREFLKPQNDDDSNDKPKGPKIDVSFYRIPGTLPGIIVDPHENEDEE